MLHAHALFLALVRISPLIPETARVLLQTGLDAQSTRTHGTEREYMYFAVLACQASAGVPLTARGLAKHDTAGVMPCNSAPDAVNALRT